jgi:hypothetical protein
MTSSEFQELSGVRAGIIHGMKIKKALEKANLADLDTPDLLCPLSSLANGLPIAWA